MIGQELGQPKHLSGGTIGLVVGILGALYGGLGVAQAFQYATNTMWGIPRNNRPNPLKARWPQRGSCWVPPDWPSSPRPACPSWAAVARARSGKRRNTSC